jgi:hypothetical protein
MICHGSLAIVRNDIPVWMGEIQLQRLSVHFSSVNKKKMFFAWAFLGAVDIPYVPV